MLPSLELVLVGLPDDNLRGINVLNKMADVSAAAVWIGNRKWRRYSAVVKIGTIGST